MIFNKSFDPFKGDVIYGLTAQRADYLMKWQDYQARTAVDDKYRNFTIYNRYFLINDFNEPIIGGNFSEEEDIRLANRDRVQNEFIEALSDTRYSPYSIAKVRLSRLIKLNDATFMNMNWRLAITAKEKAELMMIYAVRRACKFGIYYISSGQYTKGKIHYILDSISVEEVIERSEQVLFTGKVGIPITTSELRFVFRHWYLFKGSERFMFWCGSREVNAPWEDNPKGWTRYAEHRVKKYKRKLDRDGKYLQVAEFYEAYNLGLHKEAINKFHDMEVGRFLR